MAASKPFKKLGMKQSVLKVIISYCKADVSSLREEKKKGAWIERYQDKYFKV